MTDDDKATKEEAKKKAAEAQADEPEVEVKAEEDIIPEVAGAIIVDEAEDEKELKEKIRKELPKDKKSKGAFDEYDREIVWTPNTKLGQRVYNGEISTIHDIIAASAPIREVGIVDKLLPGLLEEVIDVGRVQRVTDSGRRMRFRVVTAVGNGDGYIGVGEAKGKEAGSTIRKSIERAKLNIKEIKRGCGSWECGCGKPHTVPFKTVGKSGSVTVTLMPAPRGVGIVSGENARMILALAGVTDVWVKASGHTRSGLNFAHAVVEALENTNYMKISKADEERLKIVTGAAKVTAPPQEVME
ncbi:MAG: 30S ribosomal protein S5 [Candidatus Altiarchaeota archaeon]